MAQLFASPFYTGQDNGGRPMSFARWYFYETGTLDPATVYADADLSVPLGAIVTADSAGRFPTIYLDDEQTYRAALMEAGQPPLPIGGAIRDIDPVNPEASAGSPIEGGFDTVHELLNDNNEVIGYAGSGAQYIVQPGDIVTAGGFRYRIAASGATDEHVTTAGGVKLYAELSDDGAFNVLAFGAGNGEDDTPIFQGALEAAVNGEIAGNVTAPPGSYRIDGKIVLFNDRHLHVSTGATLTRMSEHSDNTDALVLVRGINATLSGDGHIRTQNDHPTGIIQCGHENTTTSTWNSLYWKVRNVRLFGQQTAGNVGIYVPSSQMVIGSSAANYFGSIENVRIDRSDVGVLFTDIANAHTCVNIGMWRMISYGYKLIGAYSNQIFGGFLHASTNGVVGIGLFNRTPGGPHDSDQNQIYGYGVEPGGALSKAVTIESNCTRNYVRVIGNVANQTSSDIQNPNNTVDTGFVSNFAFKTYQGLNNLGVYQTPSRQTPAAFTGTVAENASVIAATVNVGTTGRSALVEVVLAGQGGALKGGGGRALFNVVRRTAGQGGTTVDVIANDSMAGTQGVAIGAPTVNGNSVEINVAGLNNGGAINYSYVCEVSVLSPNRTDFTVS